MVLSELRGAVGFLTRVPIGLEAADWRAFSAAPWAFTIVAVPIGLLLAAPLAVFGVLGRPALGTVGFLAVWLSLLGITHLDGVADLGDAAVVHGDADERVAVLKDSDVGVGAAVALGFALLGTALSAYSLVVVLPRGSIGTVVSVVIGAELGAKTAMAAVACLGEARHEGLGSQFTDWNGGTDLVPVGLVVLGIAVAGRVLNPTASPVVIGSLLGALIGGALVAHWATRLIDGVSGDVFGAVDVTARLAGLFTGALLLGVAV